jgi:hypothetical protein
MSLPPGAADAPPEGLGHRTRTPASNSFDPLRKNPRFQKLVAGAT